MKPDAPRQEQCFYCKGWYPWPIQHNHDAEECAEEEKSVIKPCPCCGGEAKLEQVPHKPRSRNSGGYYIECSRCGITTRLVFAEKGDVERELREVWNRRSAVAPTPPSDAGKPLP